MTVSCSARRSSITSGAASSPLKVGTHKVIFFGCRPELVFVGAVVSRVSQIVNRPRQFKLYALYRTAHDVPPCSLIQVTWHNSTSDARECRTCQSVIVSLLWTMCALLCKLYRIKIGLTCLGSIRKDQGLFSRSQHRACMGRYWFSLRKSALGSYPHQRSSSSPSLYFCLFSPCPLFDLQHSIPARPQQY